MTCDRDPDLGPVRRYSDAVEATIAERPAAREPHPAHGHDCSVLAHANYRVVAAVRHIEVGPFFERRVAGPVGSFRFDRGRGQINWLIERIGVDAMDRSHPGDHAVVNQVNDRDRVLKRLADVKDSCRRVVEDHTELNICTRPPRVDACPPAAAKPGGITRVSAKRGSIDRNEPSRSSGFASGAPKFDRLPTRMRAGSSIRPGCVKAANAGLSWIGPPGRKLPTGLIAETPGMPIATIRPIKSSFLPSALPALRRPMAATPTTKAMISRMFRLLIFFIRTPFSVGLQRAK